MTMRAMGPFNGTLPAPTGMAIAYVRDAKKFPFLNYMQLVSLGEVADDDVNFMYWKMNIDDPVRLATLKTYAWGYDDYRPSGRAFNVSGDWTASSVERWDFPWQLGNQTQKSWRKNGIDPKMIYDKILIHKANLHRAQRCLDAITGATYEQSGTLNAVLGTSGAYWDKSSGEEFDGGGTANPNFQIIKKSFMRINRRLHLATNGVASMENMVCIIPPVVAEKLATCGEIVSLLKQSQYADELKTVQYAMWGLPTMLYNVRLVVEDTPRVFINKAADGVTVADVTVSAQKDYILTGDTVYFGLRPEGLDGGIGMRTFSTWQLYHKGGEMRIEAFSEPKHDLIEGHVVLEDKALAVATVAGYKLIDVLST